MSPRQRDRKRNGHGVTLVGGSARIPIVQKMFQEFFNGKEQKHSAELVVLSRHTHRNRFADELGRQNYGTGETWKNKPLFRLALDKEVSDGIAADTVNITRDAE